MHVIKNLFLGAALLLVASRAFAGGGVIPMAAGVGHTAPGGGASSNFTRPTYYGNARIPSESANPQSTDCLGFTMRYPIDAVSNTLTFDIEGSSKAATPAGSIAYQMCAGVTQPGQTLGNNALTCTPTVHNALANTACTGNGNPSPCCTGAGAGTCPIQCVSAGLTVDSQPAPCCTGLGTGSCSSGVNKIFFSSPAAGLIPKTENNIACTAAGGANPCAGNFLTIDFCQLGEGTNPSSDIIDYYDLTVKAP